MSELKRVFIFGAGFSKPAGMPLATELLPWLLAKLDYLEELREWIEDLHERLVWLNESSAASDSFALNIEQVFHYAHFDIEAHRLRQHLVPVGRGDGPGTSWKQAESVNAWLTYLEYVLCDVIAERDAASDLSSINRWVEGVGEHDAVLTFNYDTLVERSLAASGKAWNHGFDHDKGTGTSVFKLHGSIDWIVAHRSDPLNNCDLLFQKENSNRSDGKTGHIEDDCLLWRCRAPEQMRDWIEGRHLQLVPNDAASRKVGIAGLGAYKELHKIPGLGYVWVHGMKALIGADLVVVVGFSLSDFDAMAQLQFAAVASARDRENRPLRVIIVDPFVNKAAEDRFRRVFRSVDFIKKRHEEFDWSSAT